jgi:hypothetical protein
MGDVPGEGVASAQVIPFRTGASLITFDTADIARWLPIHGEEHYYDISQHEIGHAVGLGHFEGTVLMNAFTQSTDELGAPAIAELRRLGWIYNGDG